MSTNSISQTIDRALTAAGLNTESGPLQAVTTTIEKALASAGLMQLRKTVPGPAPRQLHAPPPMLPAVPNGDSAPAADPGQFLELAHTTGMASRAYKLYVPARYRGEPAPLVVMLHGCKQNPDDFATGTRMNRLAEREGFLVAYPAQTVRDNGANCWNWFDSSQQRREGLEPSLIAGIVRDIGRSHAVDSARVFAAGLSAGAAMAVILGAAYPELFAAVAAHSGLPVGAANNMTSAFAAMQGRPAAPTGSAQRAAVPTIVFHGDADRTVVPGNGSTIVEQALLGFAGSKMPLHKRQRPTAALDGSSFTTTDYADATGTTRVEEWVVHGGLHTWFGGSADGSYTDPAGPDASAEIVRFFLSQRPS